MKVARFISPLVFILLLGAVLRFWNLDFKPLWMDEIITALFSFGQNYYAVPLEQALPVPAFEQVFTLKAGASCPQITETVSTQSVHPPLFFCWMHSWLRWIDFLPTSWTWKLRALPALFGVGAIAAVYQLSSIAFSRRAGILSAIVMAISPFGVYLSQEARHYTLPFLLVTLALLGLYYVLLDLQQHQIHPLRWLGWILANSIGFYVHYFFLLAFAAQIITLLVVILHSVFQHKALKQEIAPSHFIKGYVGVSLAIALIGLTWLPWLTTFLSHMNRPETDWVQSGGSNGLALLAPLFQLAMGMILMAIALPVENQPPWIAIPNGIVMFLFAVWFAWQIKTGVQRLWQGNKETQLASQLLLVFIGTVLLEFLAIAYLLGKDLTQVPRYNFMYFPAFCALMGAALSQVPVKQKTFPLVEWLNKRAVPVVLLVSILSTTFVLSNQVFQKPYTPEQVAANIYREPNVPLFVVAAYNDFQDIALGLSFAIALRETQQPLKPTSEAHFALLSYLNSYEAVWQRLPELKLDHPFPLNFWIIAPGLKRVGYRQQLFLTDKNGERHTCTLDPDHFYRIGVPYQLYRCQ